MRKRRSRKPKSYVNQKAVVSLNPQYFEGLPDSLQRVLPPPKSADDFPFIWQEQHDSGHYLVFFNVSGWKPDMDYMTIFTESESRQDTIFSVMGESHFAKPGEFMAKMGYDIPYDRIESFDYNVFKRFVSVSSGASVKGILNKSSGFGFEEPPLAFAGTLLWLPKEIRDSVSAIGMFGADVNEHFNFASKS